MLLGLLALWWGAYTALAGPARAAAVHLTYYHRSNTTEVEWTTAVIERFGQLHPEIEVESLPSGTGGGPDYAEKLAVLRAAGNAPDVFFGSTDKLGYILRGWTLDLTPYVNRDRAELAIDTFFPGVWETFVHEGRTYGIPLGVTPQLVFYNKDLFARDGLASLPIDWEETSWNWERFVEYGQKLTHIERDGSYSQLALAQATESHLPDVVWMFGGDWFEPEAYRTAHAQRVTLTRPENLQAYEALRDYYASYAAAGPPKGISAWSGFVEGRIAMDWIGAWKMNTYLEAERSGSMNFKWGIAPVPLVRNRANTRWTDPLYISATTPHPEEAWEFVKFATGEEGQALWSAIAAFIPARRTAAGAYVKTVQAASGMGEAEILQSVSGALAHSRRSLEESIADLPLEIARLRGEWIDPMLAGERPIQSTLAAFEQVLNAKLRDLAET
ncbi:MAG TPA: sugar ABC transporter substrate-binding protein [Limnochordia bacterium]